MTFAQNGSCVVVEWNTDWLSSFGLIGMDPCDASLEINVVPFQFQNIIFP
jgi:hypothetical protein